MPLTEKGQEIMKSMQKQYGKKKGKEVFYASKNAGKITGVEKKMKVKKAKTGKLVYDNKKMTPEQYLMKEKKLMEKQDRDALKSLKKLKGGGAAIKGINFKGTF